MTISMIETVEDDIIDAIDEKYQEYLQGLDPDTKIRDIIKINDFLRTHIAKKTEKHVVIRDESGE